jgi:hypothetical protein
MHQSSSYIKGLNMRLVIHTLLGKNARSYPKNKMKRAGGMAHVIEPLPTKHEGLSSKPQ